MAGTHTAADPGTVLASWQCWLWCPHDRAWRGCSWVCGPLASVAVGGMRAVTWAGAVCRGLPALVALGWGTARGPDTRAIDGEARAVPVPRKCHEQPWYGLMPGKDRVSCPGVRLCLSAPMGQWLCPTGEQGDSEGQATAWALADLSSMFTGPSACLLTRSLGFRRGKPKTDP